jgi:hypothetical protein
MSTTADGDVVTLSFEDYDRTLLPIPGRVVRMPHLEGFYRLEKLGSRQTRVVYQVEMDIGGSVPDRIADRVARDMPYEKLSRLRERVANP